MMTDSKRRSIYTLTHSGATAGEIADEIGVPLAAVAEEMRAYLFVVAVVKTIRIWREIKENDVTEAEFSKLNWGWKYRHGKRKGG